MGLARAPDPRGEPCGNFEIARSALRYAGQVIPLR